MCAEREGLQMQSGDEKKVIYDCPATSRSSIRASTVLFIWSQTVWKTRLSAWQRKIERSWQSVCLRLCLVLLSWRFSSLITWIGESQERRITIYDYSHPSCSPPLPSPWGFFFGPKRCLSRAIINLLVCIPLFRFSNLQKLSRPWDVEYVCVSDIHVWIDKEKACWTCLCEKHREVGFTAKNPNRELWRF